MPDPDPPADDLISRLRVLWDEGVIEALFVAVLLAASFINVVTTLLR